MPICRSCGEDTKLCWSHAIPDAIFRPILRANNGSAIGLPKGDGKIHLTQDTGKAELFCNDCETAFNLKFDAPFINVLRELDTKICNESFSARVNFDHGHFARCIASIFWRASVSPAHMYSEVKLAGRHERLLLKVMKSSNKNALLNCSVKFQRLRDLTPAKKAGFTQDGVSDFILNINAYKGVVKRKHASIYLIMDMAFSGFLFHIVAPRLPYRKNKKLGFLKRSHNILHAPPIDMMEYPPIMDSLVSSLQKENDGMIIPSARRRKRKGSGKK